MQQRTEAVSSNKALQGEPRSLLVFKPMDDHFNIFILNFVITPPTCHATELHTSSVQFILLLFHNKILKRQFVQFLSLFCPLICSSLFSWGLVICTVVL